MRGLDSLLDYYRETRQEMRDYGRATAVALLAFSFMVWVLRLFI